MANRKHVFVPGTIYGRLTGIREVQSRKNGRYILCECRCGKTNEVNFTTLRSGEVVSCGCYHSEMVSERATIRNYRHGMSRTDVYNIWHGMVERCTVENAAGWDNYGAKGIKVCQRWMDFVAFFEDMGPRPSSKHSLDRFPNNRGDYEPGNVRWATPKQQARNRTNTVLIEHNGEFRCMAEWAEIYGVSSALVKGRLRAGWPISMALRPPRRKRR